VPIVKIDILKGRTIEAKENMMLKVSEAISQSLEVDIEKVRIIVSEMEECHYSVAGKSIRAIKEEEKV